MTKSTAVLLVIATSVFAQCPQGVNQNFDAAGLGTPTCGAPAGTFPAGWTDGGSGNSWRVWTGGTPSGGTGPSFDATSGTGNYMYCEASGCNTALHYLLTPCLNLIAGAPSMTFSYHMFGTAVGTLVVEESDGAGGWTQVFTLTGSQGNSWQTTTVALTPMANAQVRFCYTTTASFSSDCAIDDVLIGTPTDDWELNGPGSSLDIDGVLATGPFGSPAITSTCTGNNVTVTSSSTAAGAGWEVALTTSPVVPASGGGQATPGGQAINVAAFSPGAWWFNGGGAPNFGVPYPSGGLSVSFNVGSTPMTLSMQQVNLATGHPEGYELSQACQLEVTTAPTFPAAGPTGDDSSATIDFGCPSIPFFGTVYQQVHISSNGRVVFGGPDTDWSPTVAELLSGNGSVGFWSDFSPQNGGNIDVTNPAPGVFSVNYTTVPYYTEPLAPCSWNVVFDASTGTITLDNLSGIMPNPISNTNSAAGDVAILGISPGGGATDPGATLFSPGSSGVAGAPTDALYDIYVGGTAGTCPSLMAGTNQIQLLPTAGIYAWVAN